MFKPILRSIFALIVLTGAFALRTLAGPPVSEVRRWEQQAQNVTIVRDDWGIAHVTGRTDADAVFGMIYAQAEDDFNRVENNYLLSMGRLAEAEGESAIYRDLRMRIFIDPDDLKAKYVASPAWLKELMNAWADGLDFYLAKHPDIKPRVITHFEPWMALSFTEGSIGGDIESIDLSRLKDLYGGDAPTVPPSVRGGDPSVSFSSVSSVISVVRSSSKPLTTESTESTEENPEFEIPEPSGSNGFAIAPSNTADHHALLLINPHTSFFFRSELQMTSGEGLNAYGAVTWGQFFVYQGFNEHCGWMHTSSAVDQMDEYKETITRKGDKYFYKYADKQLPVTTSTIRVPYKTSTGMTEKSFTIYRTQHGPVVRKTTEDGQWVSIRLMQEPIKALTQSYSRIKSKNYKDFRQTMELHTNSSNNTIFADADGDIAYFHGNFIPRRDPKFDWTKAVDGSDPATDWHGLLSVDESPKLLNPASGWLYNSNNSPWSAAGASSPKQSDFPKYVDDGVESARGLHAIRVLENKKDFTLDSLVSAAYDSYLTWFDKPLPALFKAWDATPPEDPLKAKTAEQIAALRSWDQRWSTGSIPTSLAVYWAENLSRRIGGDARNAGMSVEDYAVNKASREQLLQSFSLASDRLTADFGTWKTPWGDINRFQRITDDIVHPFTDAGPSIPVGFTSAVWGSLASFGARTYTGTKKMYGTSGNSFVAVVEFGPQIRARAVTAGGESGDAKSPHFNDQAKRYSTGDLRDVYFYPSQLKGHTERTYHPGS